MDELVTATTEVEMIVNSRPLSYLSTEDIEEPLTPSHHITGRRLMSLQDGPCNRDIDDTIEVNQNTLTKQMVYLSRVLDHFWGRWKKDYLLELRNSHRHTPNKHPADPINIGDIVIVQETDQPRGFWRLAKIEDLITDSGGSEVLASGLGQLEIDSLICNNQHNCCIHWKCIVGEIPTIMSYLTPLSQINRGLISLFPLRLMWGAESHHPDQRELMKGDY